MAPNSFDIELDTLDIHEQESILPAFNSDIAWEIGSIIRRRAQSHAAPIVINIAGADGQTFFHALSKPGTNLDNQAWVERKRRTVAHFGRSSFYMGCKLRRQNKTIDKAFYLDEKDYATHGGGFPLRVKGTEGIVAIVVVSGLRQDLDHMIIYESIKEFLTSYRKLQQQQQQKNNISVTSPAMNQPPLQTQPTQQTYTQPRQSAPMSYQQHPQQIPQQQHQPRKYPAPTLETVYQ